ncbi:hypothetical protein [Microbispora sp. NPDC049125]|uniref:hypothetical protein n=1 Tax=Microbispora sp. NPDC049125 TaxID=3154929 RepID=UPI003466F4ED
MNDKVLEAWTPLADTYYRRADLQGLSLDLRTRALAEATALARATGQPYADAVRAAVADVRAGRSPHLDAIRARIRERVESRPWGPVP